MLIVYKPLVAVGVAHGLVFGNIEVNAKLYFLSAFHMYNKLKYIAVKAQPAALLCHIMIGIFDILIAYS